MTLRESILQKRYYLKDDQGNIIEDWERLCRRVAKAVADKDYEDEFFNVIFNHLFLPNTPTLTNAGSPNFSLSACFVLPVEDSIESIYDAIKYSALIHKAGGGTGYNFSNLRPNQSRVKTTNDVASGPVSFIKVFDSSTEAIKQAGRRRGASIAILDINHPDIIEFIVMKRKDGSVKNFNISVAITDEFLTAVKANAYFNLTFKDEIVKKVKAKELWDLLVECAWENGEPGILFIDTINKFNTLPALGKIRGVNPCGEAAMLEWEACVLGSVNLSKMVEKGKINFDLLEKTVKTGTRFLDNIIDVQDYPLPQIEKMHKSNRKIGLGVMGWADLLIKMKIPYNSDEALQKAEEVMEFTNKTAINTSIELAEEKGVFPNHNKSTWEMPIRNASVTVIAPTGTLSLIAEVSSGIEPNFEFETTQRRMEEEFTVVHPLYKQFKKDHPDKPLPNYFVTAQKIAPEWHVRMQAAFQKHVHIGISKTINMPSSATKEDVDKMFMLSYELGNKGVTIYRDGSRKGQVISATKKIPPSCVLDAKRVQIPTPDGNIYLTIGMNPTPVELFITTPDEAKYGGEIYDAFARLFSVSLRYGVPIESLLEQLEKANRKYGSIVSVPAAIIRAFSMLKINGTGHKEGEKCPDCQEDIVMEEGCKKCPICGWSKCN